MNFLKRAITSIKRRPGKSLILLLLVTILGAVISGAIAVEGAVNNTENNLRCGMRPIVSFDIDEVALQREMEMSGEERFDLMTIDMVRALGILPYVEHYDYSIMTEMGTTELFEYRGEHGGGSYTIDNHTGEELPWGWFTFRGTSMPEPLDMREGLIELTSGVTFTDAWLTQASTTIPALISTGVAQANDLSVGSFFTINQTHYRPIMDGNWDRERTEEDIFAQMIFEFEVVGLFDVVEPTNIDMSDPDQQWEVQHQRRQLKNRIYIPNLAAEAIQRFELDTQFAIGAEYWDEPENPFGEEPQLFQTVMMLHDIDNLESFRSAAEAIIPDMWYVADLTGSFSEITTSMSSLQDIAHWVLIVSVGATLLILSLLITLFLKDRRYEMGVYLALGEKKIKIIIQIVTEVTLIAVIAITLALFIGHIASSMLSTNMVREQLMTPTNAWDSGHWETGLNAIESLGLDTTLSVEEMMEAFDVTLNIETVGLFYAIGLGAVILSTLAPVLYIVALKPKKVLL